MFGNQVSFLNSQCQWRMFEFQAPFCVGLANRISLDSTYLDAAFCLPCVLLGVQFERNTSKQDKLYKSPLTLWTSAISRFTKHASRKCEVHNLAVIAMDNFVRNMTREAVPIISRSTTYFNNKSTEIKKF